MIQTLNCFKNKEHSINFKGNNKTKFSGQNSSEAQVSQSGKINDSYGRALVKPAVFQDVETGKTVYLQNGCAYDDNGDKYTGTIGHNDRCGNQWELYYVNGKIKSSAKNGQLYKLFSHMGEVPPKAAGYVQLDDGSKMLAEQFFEYRDAKKISITDFENNKNTILVLNPKAKYKNEPLVTRTTNWQGTIQKQEYLKTDGEEKKPNFLFSSIDEANRYFMSEYGMLVSFDTVIQAQIVKSAIDDFIKFSGEIKKLLPCVYIESGQLEMSEIARISIPIQVGFEDEELMSEYNRIVNYSECTDFLRKNKPDQIFAEGGRIILNNHINWNNNESIKKLSFLFLKKQTSADTLKDAIMHELGHMVHACNSPYKYRVFGFEKPDNISQEVSCYAASCKNEFVAEYIAGRMAGNAYSPEVNALYREYGGPNLFNDWEE